MMDDGEKDGAKRAEPTRSSKKSIEEVLKRVARPAWRSPLFWWLVEHHDALRQNEAETGCGVPWRELCVDFVGLGITLADGRPVKPATARITWQRVRKEVVRAEERRARERAERERRAATNPRRNMPSRFTGSFPAPLSDRQPPPAPPPPSRVSPSKAGTAVAIVGNGAKGGAIRLMPGGPVLTGGFEDKLPAEFFTVECKGEPIDIRLFIRPGEERSWELRGENEVGWARVLKQRLLARFDSWVTDRVGNPNNPIDVEWRKRLGKP
jgi:hypothetical protein